jgi:transposase
MGHPRAITQVAIDTSPAHKNGVEEHFGNATVVFDKFHVISQVAQAVDDVRRLEVRRPYTAPPRNRQPK